MRAFCNFPSLLAGSHALRARRSFVCVALLLGILPAGCGQEDQITRYTVPKEVELAPEPVAPAGPPTDRMLGAMVPMGEQFWFFKAVGPLDVVDKHRDEFDQFVASLKFEDGKPSWTLPAGWRGAENTGAAASMRFATVEFGPESKPVELTVTPLPAASDDPETYVLTNVNRWRGQLQLPDIARSQLANETKTVELDGATATVVDIAGRMQTGSSMRAPFASGAAGGPAERRRPAASSTASTAATGPKYDVPAGWKPGRTGPFREIAFEVEHDGKQAELTVSSLSGNAGGTLANVNRWRGQINLPATSQEQLDQALLKVTVDGQAGQLVELSGEASDEAPAQSIVAVLVPMGDRTWFIKMKGDQDVVRQERAHFDEFVASLRFGGTEGERND